MSDILNQFRDEELPMSTVDIHGAMKTARRRRRTQTLASLAAGVAVVAAGATAPIWLNRQTAQPPAATGCDTTWEQFDPLTSEIDASGVMGYRLTASTTSTYFQLAGLADQAGDRDIQVILYACGGQPWTLDQAGPVDPGTGQPADPVNGAAAYWLPTNDPGDPLGLAWQWTPGAWAIVSPIEPEPGQRPLDGPDELRATAQQVAAQLRFGAGTPVTAPLALPTPDGTYPALTMTLLAADNGRQFPIGYGIGFDPVGTPAPRHFGEYRPYLSIRANPFAAVDDLPDYATPYSEDLGYPAYASYSQQPGGGQVDVLLVFDFFTFGLEIEPALVPGTRAERLAVAADVFRTITVYPDSAAELSAWADPLA